AEGSDPVRRAGSGGGRAPASCSSGPRFESSPGACSHLAARAEPGAAPARAGLLDRGTAAVAGLARAAVHAELVLHPSAGVRAITEVCALAADAEAQRPPDALAQATDLVGGELACGPQRMDPRVPERLVRVDVSEPGDGPLVEERGLERRLPAGQALREVGGREPASERLRAEPDLQVRLGLL